MPRIVVRVPVPRNRGGLRGFKPRLREFVVRVPVPRNRPRLARFQTAPTGVRSARACPSQSPAAQAVVRGPVPRNRGAVCAVVNRAYESP